MSPIELSWTAKKAAVFKDAKYLTGRIAQPNTRAKIVDKDVDQPQQVGYWDGLGIKPNMPTCVVHLSLFSLSLKSNKPWDKCAI